MKKPILSLIVVVSMFAVTACNDSKSNDHPTPEPQVIHLAERVGVAAANTVGWSSVTKYQHATTTVQKNIVNKASFSGPSFPSKTGGHWGVDTDGDDGTRMSNAIVDYHNWYHTQRTKANGVSLASIRNTMIGRLNNPTQKDTRLVYSAASKTELVNRIITIYNSRPYPAISIKPNNQEVINFLGIRAQCKEFTDIIALACSGQARTYKSTGVLGISNFRPGMALYDGETHAMLILDIFWDAKGSPTKYIVAEVNYCTTCNWTNPVGQRPWERTTNRREVPNNKTSYKVVSYE
jgi:hypothetical protein